MPREENKQVLPQHIFGTITWEWILKIYEVHYILLISAVHHPQAVYMSREKKGRPSEAFEVHPIDSYLIFDLARHVRVTAAEVCGTNFFNPVPNPGLK